MPASNVDVHGPRTAATQGDTRIFGGPADVPITPRSFRAVDGAILGGCALSALALVWLIFERLAPFSGALAFVVCWFSAFIVIYWLVVRELEDRVIATDKLATVVITAGALLFLVPLALIVGYVIYRGIGAFRPSFFTQTLQSVGPLSSATAGGGAHAVVGTLEEVAIAVLLSVPIGVLCAVFMNEIGGPLERPVRLFVDAMSGVPSIVAGLFIYAIWVVGFHKGFSGLAAAFALSVLMLPTITRTAEEVLRLVPDGLREASFALGVPEWRTVWGVVLPTARGGLITAVILGVARAVGETAPLIMTSFGASLTNWNPLHGSQSSLPLFVYEQIRSPKPAQIARAWTGALVLIGLVLALFSLARYLGARADKGARSKGASERAQPIAAA